MKYLQLFILGLFISFITQGQSQPESKYVPGNLFPSIPIMPAGNPYRSATGVPGEAYWQNCADYTIDVSLDDQLNRISGTEIISYTNKSPQTLSYLWLQLDQNSFREHSKALDSQHTIDSFEIKTNHKFIGGYEIHLVEVITDGSQQANTSNAEYVIYDNQMRLFLPQPLLPGKKVSFKIKYSYTIPEHFFSNFGVNRTDILPTKNGVIYSIAQWYPRLCVLDDVEGWNNLPYLGNGEFYLEYGNFNVNIALPSAYIVQASGELLNPQEVMTALQLKRWEEAKNSDQKVFIRTPEEVTDVSSRPSKPNCTWKFKIDNSRDFAWTASKSFIWEGIRINLPSGKKALGVSLYPIESKKPGSWERSCEYVKFSIEYFSNKWYEYPYPCAVNVASNLDGMEYPGIVFCSAKDTGNDFWMVAKHELSHTWFPMIVGSNERKYAWMDEGFNTFIDNLAEASFNNGEFKGYMARDLPFEQYFSDSLVPVLTRPDAMGNKMVFVTQYLKTAYVLRLLRDEVIGAERFDFAFKKYIADWAYKHPTPWDFFQSMNNSTGEDLSWYWKEMFIENYKLDQAITAMEYINNDPSQGAVISIVNLEKGAMPLIIQITTKSGKKEIVKFPVEVWEYTSRYVFKTNSTEPIQRIVIDPDALFPDVNRANNVWSK
jgi:hypothetical protein